MKKQATIRKSNRNREGETATTQFPIQTAGETQPRGLYNRSSSKPTQLNKGAAESPHTKPAGDLRRGNYPGNRKEP